MKTHMNSLILEFDRLPHPCGSALNSWEALRIIAITAISLGLIKGAIMKFPSILSAKSLVLTGALIFSTAGILHAQGYDQGGSMQKPDNSTQSGTSGGGSDYGTKRDEKKSGYDGSRRSSDNSRYSTDGTERYDDKDESAGTDGTGPKLKGRY